MFKRFIIDCDGVLTDGKMYWTADGSKTFKVFGSYDHDGLKLLRPHIDIQFITADRLGFDIVQSRVVDHMKFPLYYVTEKDRMQWVLNAGPAEETIFMGDGPYDAPILKAVGLGITPKQAWDSALDAADIITEREGGSGAVAEACLKILKLMGKNIWPLDLA